jgi:hypothetical protein
MTASSFLAELWQRGLVVRLSDDRSRIVVPRSGLSPEMRAQLVSDRPQIVKLLVYADEYRALIRNAFAVMVDRPSARHGLREFASDQARLTDELGPALTTAIRNDEARRWRQDTGLCPVCAEARHRKGCLEVDRPTAPDERRPGPSTSAS